MRRIALGFAVLALVTSAALADGLKDANAGLEALGRGDYSEAVRLFTSAINSSDLSQSDRESAHIERARAYLGLGNKAAALHDLERAEYFDPNDKDIAALRAQANAQGSASNNGQQGPPKEDGLKDANAGEDALRLGDYSKAIELFTRAINSGELSPSDKKSAYIERAKAYFGQHDNTSAMADLDSAAKLNPNDGDIADLRSKVQEAAAPPPPPPSVYSQPKWGAIAVALWNDFWGVAKVEAAISWNQTTLEAAESIAIDRCQRGGGEGCIIKGTWSSGCGYISTGASGGRVAWGFGPTPDDAARNCSSQGVVCDPPIGGCND